MTKRENPKRPPADLPEIPGMSFEEIEQWITSDRSKPFYRAQQKLTAFINACVGDQDFRDPESGEPNVLLDTLLAVRDVFLDGANEQWSMDDVLVNIEEALKKALATRASDARWAEQRDRHEEIKKIWAGGKYTSRDICAEEEWSALGFGSFSAARKALRNTPDPT